jgi:hypothetical protein
MLEMDWGDNREIVDSTKHVVVVASGKVESCNPGSDAGASIALEVTHKVGKHFAYVTRVILTANG